MAWVGNVSNSSGGFFPLSYIVWMFPVIPFIVVFGEDTGHFVYGITVLVFSLYFLISIINEEVTNDRAKQETKKDKPIIVKPDNIRASEYFILDSQYLTPTGMPDFRYATVKDMFISKWHLIHKHKYDYINGMPIEGMVKDLKVEKPYSAYTKAEQKKIDKEEAYWDVQFKLTMHDMYKNKSDKEYRKMCEMYGF